MRLRLLALLALPLLAACKDDAATSPAGIELDERSMAVTSQVEGNVLVLRNAADFAVRVGVLERTMADNQLAQWCFGADDCGTALAGGAQLRVPLSAVQGYSASADELAVFWWNPADPGRVSGEGAPVVEFSVALR